ncbi:GDSL-type esterase/lipase family protein [Rubritalea tangerina]|uniref:GDSL-type esterase/lipase family protein n=1 Tax=Rubritalea tangerina TaxID=430798 RepID=A0ABW4Z6E0_9BACT
MKYTLVASLLWAGAWQVFGQSMLSNGSFETAADSSYNQYHYNRFTTVAPWVIDRAGNNYGVARVNQSYASSSAVQVGSLVGSAGMWLSANGNVSQAASTSFAAMGVGQLEFSVKIGQSSNFAATNSIALEVLDGDGTVLASNVITSLSPGDDLSAFSLSYATSGQEAGSPSVRVRSGAGSTSGVFVIDDAQLLFEGEANSQKLIEPVVWVNVDTQLGAGGPVKKYWEHRHDQITGETGDKVGVLFVGDSITDQMTRSLQTGPYVLVDSEHKPLFDATWTSRFKPVNAGIAGQVTQNIRWQVANGVYDSVAKPEVISLMIGTNNLHQNAIASGSSPAPALGDVENREDVVIGIQAVVQDLRAWSPDSVILLHSILPRNFNGADPVSNNLVEGVNADIAVWAAGQVGVEYVDLYTAFSDGSGGIDTSLYDTDQLHLSSAGYSKWFEVLKPLVEDVYVVGPQHIEQMDIPQHRGTVAAKPDYSEVEGKAGTFGWNTSDKSETWSEAFQRARGTAPTQEAELVFIGDSVLMSFGSVGGRTHTFDRGSATWNAFNYDQYSAVNAAMSGNQTQNTLWMLENGLLDGIGKPKMFVVIIGTNNREGVIDSGGTELVFNPDGAQTSQQIAEGILSVVQGIQAIHPKAHIVCTNFLRGAHVGDPERVVTQEVDVILEKAFARDSSSYLHYFDINEVFIDPASPNGAYYSNYHVGDNIHPNNNGYTALATALQPYIDKYVKVSDRTNRESGVTAIDATGWQEEVARGTVATVSDFSLIRQNAGVTVDLSGLSGDAAYEFIVRARDVGQASAILLADSNGSMRLEQWNNREKMGISYGGDHVFEPLYGTSVASPYGGFQHMVFNVHAEAGFTHVFLNGSLVGVLNRAYTFNQAASSLANISAEPLGAANEEVLHGFAAYDGVLSDEEIARHHRAAFCYALAEVEFSQFPKHLQLYPRGEGGTLVTVPVSGNVLESGYDAVVLKLWRDGVVYGGEVVSPLTYVDGEAAFSLSPSIVPELAQYTVRCYLRDASGDTLVGIAHNIVAGDVYLVQGQSNAYARNWNGSANENLGPYLRSFGTNPIFQFGESANEEAMRAGFTQADVDWHYAIADEDVDNNDDDRARGHVGQLGARIGAALIEQHQVPVAVITGAHGGKQLDFFPRNDSQPSDTASNYGRLLWRCQKAGVTQAIRAIIFCQGESDEGIIHGRVAGTQTPEAYDAMFSALYHDWMNDYGVEHTYAIQVRPKCYDWVEPSDTRLRNYQRLWADKFSNFSVFSYNAIAGQLNPDFCHYDYVDGYEAMGNQIAAAMGRDLYEMADGGNLDAPNPMKASYSNGSRTEIVIQMRHLGDSLIVDAGVEDYFQLERADGTAINDPSVTQVEVQQHTLTLTLSGVAPAEAARVAFQSHQLEVGADYWVTNANGVGMLTFSQMLEGALTPLETWQREVQGVAPGASTQTDTDGDGLVELMEYALGTDPNGT